MVRACCVSRFCVSLVSVSSRPWIAAHVVGGFRQRARELLDRRVSIEFERIEFAARALLFFVAMQDLRFGLELELAQLLLETRHRSREFADVEIDGADLLFEARPRNAGFAGIVEQLVEKLGVDTREFGTIRPAPRVRGPAAPHPAAAAARRPLRAAAC